MTRQICIRFLSCFLVVGTALYACQVPVFRYALERWNADRYTVLVVSKGSLTDSQHADFLKLKEASLSATAGFEAQHVDISERPTKAASAIWKEYSATTDGAPLMAVLYPERAQVAARVAHCSALSKENVQKLKSSPVRSKVAQKLTSGDSATWIFVASGHDEKDKAALQILRDQLKKEEDRIQLPSAEELEVSQSTLDKSKVKLRIAFSVVELRRDDAAEEFALNALLNSEEDLRDFDEPMAFPVFGRGRVLYALIGRGINAETIGIATTFITGPCSCQVKNQNPGFDLLTGMDWNDAVGDHLISEPVPESSGTPKLLQIPPGKKK